MKKTEIRKILENNSVTFGTGEAVPEFNFNDCINDITDFAKKENAELINILGECLSYIPTGISYKGGYLKGIVKDIVNQKFKDDEKGNIEST
jgi:hypothetical protein